MKKLKYLVYIFQFVYLFPLIIVVSVYLIATWVKWEFFNENIIDYEMAKTYSGDESGGKLALDFVMGKLEPFRYHLGVISAIMWVVIIYILSK